MYLNYKIYNYFALCIEVEVTIEVDGINKIACKYYILT